MLLFFSPVMPGRNWSVPCRCVLRRDAPCQVVIAVIPAGVVKEVPSGGEDMVRYACDALRTYSELESAS